MVPLPCVRSPTGGIRIEHPTRRQPLAIPIESRQNTARIISPAHHHARMPPVQISHSRQIPLTAVGIIVAPVFQPSARRDIVHRLQGRARPPVEHGQELRSRSDIPLPAFHRFLRPHPVVRRGVAYRMSPAVHRAVCGLGRDFSPSVAIEVIHHELGVMRPRTDVAPQIDTPQTGAVQFIRIQKHGSGKTAVGIVFGIGRLPLQYNLKIPVTVQITDGRIVGRIGANLAVGHRLRLRLLQRDVGITARSIGRKCPFTDGRRFFTTVYHRTYLIYRFSPGGVIIVKLCGNSHRFRSDQQAVAIHIEYRTHRIGRQITPTHHDRIGR